MEKMNSSELELALKNLRNREELLIYEAVQKERERIAIELKERDETLDYIAEVTRLSIIEVESLEINELVRVLYVALENNYQDLKAREEQEAKEDLEALSTNNEQEEKETQ